MISGIFVQRIDWNGITVEVSYEPEWLSGLAEAFGEPLARLQVRSVSPERAALAVLTTTRSSAAMRGLAAILIDGNPRVVGCVVVDSLHIGDHPQYGGTPFTGALGPVPAAP